MDFETQWNVEQVWILLWTLDCACLDVWILGPNEIWIIDLSSALVGMLIQIISFF